MPTEIGQDVGENHGSVVGARTDADNYISFDIGDKSNKDIADIIAHFPEVKEIVFGSRSGLERWDGVVREIRELQKQFHDLGQSLDDLRKELREMKRYTKNNQDSRLLWAILIVLVAMCFLMFIGIVVIRRNGVEPAALSMWLYLI